MSMNVRAYETNKNSQLIRMEYRGNIYQFPKKIAEKYKVNSISDAKVSVKEVFSKLNAKYTKPGALLQGIRVRENLTQVQLAEMIHVTQSDISQMEKGTRKIGRKIAQRLEALFDVNYRSFLD